MAPGSSKTFQVTSSKVVQEFRSLGLGALMYDILLEAAGKDGAYVIPDRISVSRYAREIWNFYFSFRDKEIDIAQLDTLEDEAYGTIPILTPNDPKDDCSSFAADEYIDSFFSPPGAPGHERYKEEYLEEPLTKAYKKSNTNMMDKLEKAGLIKVEDKASKKKYYSDDIILEEVLNYLEEKKKKKKRKKKKKSKRKKAGTESGKEISLRDWFGRKGAKGKKSGWVDCNAPDGKGGYKACGRSKGEKRKRYPACRPTPGACKERGRGKSWGKKSKKK